MVTEVHFVENDRCSYTDRSVPCTHCLSGKLHPCVVHQSVVGWMWTSPTVFLFHENKPFEVVKAIIMIIIIVMLYRTLLLEN